LKITDGLVFIVLFAFLSVLFTFLKLEDFSGRMNGKLWIADQALEFSREMNYQWATGQADCARIRAYFKGTFGDGGFGEDSAAP
jgi:hypothetical protein